MSIIHRENYSLRISKYLVHDCFAFILMDIFIFFLGCLAATSFCVSLVISPAVMLFCRNKSTRLTAVVGGLIVSLGILFTSFATSFPHLFFSYGTVIGKACLSIIYTFFDFITETERFLARKFISRYTLMSFIAIGIGMLRDSATVMVGQYFKKKRCFVELMVVGSSGIGISLSSPVVLSMIR